MNKRFKIIFAGVFYFTSFMVAVAAIGCWMLSREFDRPGNYTDVKTVEIARGSSLFAIADALKKSGAIDDPFVFVIGTRVLNAQGDLKAGEYEFAAHASARNIMEKIRAGDSVARRVTIPEGLTSFEIVRLLNHVEALQGALTDIPEDGSLLPGSYDYAADESKASIIARMKIEMAATLQKLWDGRDTNLPLTSVQQAVILASIVEKETGVAEERRRVAGVFINRLRQGIPLQTDPSVIYGITHGRNDNQGLGPLGRRLLTKDLQNDTPYNTYLHAGLPPGAIANPGRLSIEAVLHPESHEYIYFVANGTGGHVFAKTLQEHEDNVCKWRDIRRLSNH